MNERNNFLQRLDEEKLLRKLANSLVESSGDLKLNALPSGFERKVEPVQSEIIRVVDGKRHVASDAGRVVMFNPYTAQAEADREKYLSSEQLQQS